jgi:alkanesulfonate monooxygenase SsuD/methylene tetrahydromethanopterin reductase-like flavin-dependent oxidoreductase (luciferase family)
MEIDVILDARARASELRELGQLAEHHGIRGVWVSSLLDSRDPFTNLSALAASTSRLLMGPVAVNPFDTHPVKIASAFLTLNELSAGRTRLVIGGGGEALDALDIKPLRRVRAVAECVEIIREAATGQVVNYSGEIFTVSNLRFGWVEADTPPVFVGASMPQMLAMSARVASGIMMSDMPVPLATQAISTLDESLEKFGKRRPQFETNAFAAWHVYPNREQAMREARQWLVLRGIFRPWVLCEFLDQKEVELVMASRAAFWIAFRSQSPIVDGVPDSVLDRMVENLAFVGDLSDIDKKVEKLKAYERAGLNSIALRLYRDPAESIKLLGQRVLPALG